MGRVKAPAVFAVWSGIELVYRMINCSPRAGDSGGGGTPPVRYLRREARVEMGRAGGLQTALSGIAEAPGLQPPIRAAVSCAVAIIRRRHRAAPIQVIRGLWVALKRRLPTILNRRQSLARLPGAGSRSGNPPFESCSTGNVRGKIRLAQQGFLRVSERGGLLVDRFRFKSERGQGGAAGVESP